jgi:glutaredoxin
MKRACLFFLAVLTPATALTADFYKWQDEVGRTRYTDQQPPPSAKNVQKIKAGSAGLSADKSGMALPFESRQAAEKYPVVLFSFEECGEPCKNAENLLDKRGIPYTLKNKDTDKTEMKQLTGGLTAPVLLVGKEIRKGFETEAWEKLLDAAGYAKQGSSAKPEKTKAKTDAPAAPASATTANK